MRYHRCALSVLMLVLLAGARPVVAAPLPQPSPAHPHAAIYPLGAIQTVFVILMENHNWADIHGSASAPYMNNALLPLAAHAENYHNPTNLHPSLPNYLWLEAGTNFGITDDHPPSVDHQSSTQHLTTLLGNAGITWKAYEENAPGNVCPLTNSYPYAVRHDPFVYFDDVTNTNSSSANCIAHVRPYTELATDLTNHTAARYNFITPNVCDDMHDSAGCATTDSIKNGDTWLSQQAPQILNSAAYQNNGALFITWDESEPSVSLGANPPTGMIVLSPLVKQGYANALASTHSSTLRTLEEIFAVTPLLGDAANATDLSDFFASVPPRPLLKPAGTLDPSPVNPAPPIRALPGPNGVAPARSLPPPQRLPNRVLSARQGRNP